MKPIQMVDLVAQYQGIRGEMDQAINSVLLNGTFIGGSAVNDFAYELAEYLGVKYVIPCANGTDALQAALMALNLQKGDEVITSDFSFGAAAEVICMLGLTPVFVEVDPATFQMSASTVEKAITSKTKAVIPVHLFGQCGNMEALIDVALKYKIEIIEDNAQAIGGDYIFSSGRKVKVGTMGSIGTTSFFPSKNLGCYGDGGAIFTNDDQLAIQLKMICNHGQKKKYEHERIGMNSRLDTLQAAILQVKLKHLDSFIARRKALAQAYTQSLKNIKYIMLPQQEERATHVYHQYTIRIQKEYRDQLKSYLEEKGIPSMIYYPTLLHHQLAFASGIYNGPKEENICEEVLSLPMHTEMTDEQTEYITNTIKEFIQLIN